MVYVKRKKLIGILRNNFEQNQNYHQTQVFNKIKNKINDITYQSLAKCI